MFDDLITKKKKVCKMCQKEFEGEYDCCDACVDSIQRASNYGAFDYDEYYDFYDDDRR